MERILSYAKNHEYTKYTSTLAEAWRASIAGLSENLVSIVKSHPNILEFHPDIDYSSDPRTAFGVLEAKRHRSRGIKLGMFLSLMKYYRQSYIDLIERSGFESEYKEGAIKYVIRYFDSVELGFTTEWSSMTAENINIELQSTNRDITTEKNKYLTIFESIPHPVILLSTDGRIENMNSAAASMLFGARIPGAAYYTTEFKGTQVKWFETQILEFISSQEQKVRFETEIEVSGIKRYFLVKLQRMLDVSDKFSGIVLMLMDLTDQKLTQDALLQSESLTRILLEAPSDAAMLLDLKGRVIATNSTGAKLLGESPLTAIGSTIFDQFGGASPEKREQTWARAIKTRKPQYMIDEHDEKQYETGFYPVTDESGEIKQMAVYSRDISVKHQAEQALRDNARKETELSAIKLAAATTAHEINNPLTGIIGILEMISSDPRITDTADLAREALNAAMRISDSVKRMEKMEKAIYRPYLESGKILDLNRPGELIVS